jgi:ABC-type nitrate/sulfonate/bicarbonate transport system substrate-binding protein
LDKIAFPYRSSTHLIMLHVIAQSGAFEKYGLDVDYQRYISSSQAHDAVLTGDVEFVGGNHVSTYGNRARGDNWVYLGQTISKLHHKLCVREDSGIECVEDLFQKKVGTRGSHPTLDAWLYLKKRGLDSALDQVELVNQIKHAKGSMDPKNMADPEGWTMPPLYEWVKSKEVDAAFLLPPQSSFAEDAGLKVIDLEPMPMIWFTSLSTSLRFAEKHPGIVNRFLKVMLEGIHFFKTRREESIQIIQRHHTIEGQMTYEQAAAAWRQLAPLLEPKLIPSMAAISNVYEEALFQDEDARRVNPMELWDLHFLRSIDDSGFIRDLYAQSAPARVHVGF